MKKWRINFFLHLVNLWVRLRGRYNFENLARQSHLNTFTFRTNFGKSFDFQYFNQLLSSYLGQELQLVFDPCFIAKSGKHIEGLGYFWSGCVGVLGEVWK